MTRDAFIMRIILIGYSPVLRSYPEPIMYKHDRLLTLQVLEYGSTFVRNSTAVDTHENMLKALMEMEL